ncbi:hypothetical protein A0047_07945 [Campylobacter upsaliensis]|nr:hypothetical protein [Campylobacter upsaliensis]
MGFMKAFCAAYGRNCLCLVCEGKASRIKRVALSKGGSLEREFIKRVAAAQGQARSSKVKRVAEANSPEATRQIYAKWQGKFKPKS